MARRRSWLSMAPWRRAPLMLAKRPGVALALAVAAFVATLPAAAAPLFLSSAGGATLRVRTTSVCPETLGSQVRVGDIAADSFGAAALAAAAKTEKAAFSSLNGLAPAMTTLDVDDVKVSSVADGPAEHVAVIGRDGFAGHVRAVAGGAGTGVWLADTTARRLGLSPGDMLWVHPAASSTPSTSHGRVSAGDQHPPPPFAIPVAAIYHDLRDAPEETYWCGMASLIRGDHVRSDDANAPPALDVVLVDRQTLLSLADRSNSTFTWRVDRAPVATDMTVSEALRLSDRLSATQPALCQQLRDIRNLTDRAMCSSMLAGYAGRANQIEKNLRGAVFPISAAGVLVGLIIVGAAGVLWTRRRRQELAVLTAYGAIGLPLGVKAILECAPALGLGAIAGGVAARLLVAAAGPGGQIDAGAREWSAWVCVAAFLIASVVVGIAAALASGRLAGVSAASHREWGRRALIAVPWELGLLACGGWLWWSGDSHYMVSLKDALGVLVQVPWRLVVAPMLLMVGIGSIVIRGLMLMVARFRPRYGRSYRSAIWLLYRRRLMHAATALSIIAFITAVPMSLAVFSSVATESVQATLDAQAKLATGSDVVITLSRRVVMPPALAGHATPVLRVDGVQIDGLQAILLVVEPATFGRDAYWNAQLGSAGLPELLRVLNENRPDGLAALASAPITGGPTSIALGAGPPISLDVTSVAALPVRESDYPVVVVNRSSFERLAQSSQMLATATPQLWVRGDPGVILQDARSAGLPMRLFTAADDRYVDTYYQPVTYTFAYLAALSLFIGIVMLVGFLLYLESHLPSLKRSFVMLRQMGLSPSRQGLLLLAELTTPLAVGIALGLTIATSVVRLARVKFNVDPTAEPGTVLVVPGTAITVMIVLVVAFVMVVVGVTTARLTRARAGEVLRDAA